VFREIVTKNLDDFEKEKLSVKDMNRPIEKTIIVTGAYFLNNH
jgi:hypothetical protein